MTFTQQPQPTTDPTLAVTDAEVEHALDLFGIPFSEVTPQVFAAARALYAHDGVQSTLTAEQRKAAREVGLID